MDDPKIRAAVFWRGDFSDWRLLLDTQGLAWIDG